MENMISVLATAGYIGLCVLFFSFSIAIHEFGHFLAARRLGFRVESFSIGFGHAIWKKKVRGVEYRIGWIPLGGYVSIPDLDPEGTKRLEGASGDGGGTEERNPMSPAKELAVALAGPAMNIVLAAALAVILALLPQARFGTVKAEIGDVFDGGPADRAGLRTGDHVLAVQGRPVRNWTDMVTEIQFTGGSAAELRILRDGEERTVSVIPEVCGNGASFIGALSATGSVAACAMWMPERNPAAQLLWDAGAVFRALKGLVTPREMKATARAVGGPLQIAKGTYASIRRDFCDGLGFLRFVNTNLAVMNLLPIPVLDGGLILFSLAALVFRRRIPDKVVAPVTTFFMYLLAGLMIFLMGRDAWRMAFAKGPESAKAALKSELPAADEGGGGEKAP